MTSRWSCWRPCCGRRATTSRPSPTGATRSTRSPASTFDLVVGDVQMPRASGLEILDALTTRVARDAAHPRDGLRQPGRRHGRHRARRRRLPREARRRRRAAHDRGAHARAQAPRGREPPAPPRRRRAEDAHRHEPGHARALQADRADRAHRHDRAHHGRERLGQGAGRAHAARAQRARARGPSSP